MQPFLLIYVVLASLAMMALPRRWAVVPILVTACYMTRVGVELGPLHFTVLRIVICIGVFRVLARGEQVGGSLNGLDWWMAAWGVWLVASVAFHRSPGDQVITRLGNSLDACGLYFLFRVFCSTRDEIVRTLRIIPPLLVPLALLMLIEKATVFNIFSVFGGIQSTPVVRGGKVRAQGPFDVSILAGTVAAGCIPLMMSLWWSDRRRVVVGLIAAVAIIFACTSSGPILTAAWAIIALVFWRWRDRMRQVRWAVVALYLALMLVMKDPPYFIMARIDLTGSSTGWHRSELIKSAFAHLSEWWLTGTDRTIHWMPYALAGSSDHTDITNQYLNMGVLGGLPLMLLFIMVIVKAFSIAGNALRETGPSASPWIAWALGASLFSHAVTFLSISYYDQSMVFLYMNLGMLALLANRAAPEAQHQSLVPEPVQPVATSRFPHRLRPAAREQSAASSSPLRRWSTSAPREDAALLKTFRRAPYRSTKTSAD